jgi:polyhydroxybutyrate depolymerase
MRSSAKTRRRGWALALLGLVASACLLANLRPFSGGGAVRLAVPAGGRERQFLLYVPKDLPRDTAVPLLFVYHGGGGEAKGTMNLSQFNPIADQGRFIAVYPEGIGKGWNDGRSTAVSLAHRENVDDVAFFDAMLARVAEEHAIDRRRVFVTGISNGGMFAHYLAAQRSQQIAAIAPIVGGIAEPFDREFKPTHPVSVLMIQGTEDPLVPFAGGEVALPDGKDRGSIIGTEAAAALWRVANRIDGQPITRMLPDRDPTDGCRVESTVWSSGPGGVEVWLHRVEGGGHTWPAGAQYLPKRIIGRVTHDIDSASIWEFFASHPKRE